ncbi:MAG: hypothetical protein CMM02_05090 [Rhodopirellula sp.]|nr:hypothetical protein [Rhodopirellula sp.]
MSRFVITPSTLRTKIFDMSFNKSWSELSSSAQHKYAMIVADEISKMDRVTAIVNGGKIFPRIAIAVTPSSQGLDIVKDVLTGIWHIVWDAEEKYWTTAFGSVIVDPEGVKKETGFELIIELIRRRDGVALSRNVKSKQHVLDNIAYLTNARKWATRHWEVVTKPFETYDELVDAVLKWNEDADGGRAEVIEVYGYPEAWKVSKMDSLTGLFADTNSMNFNEPIGAWNTNNVTNMAHVFSDTGDVGRESIFNMPLNGWDVSKVVTMHEMFWGAPLFNQDLNDWNVGNVTDMSGMFARTERFNGDISGWDTSSVVSMYGMFHRAEAFAPKDLNGWNTRNVEDMTKMFSKAKLFNGDISEWRVAALSEARKMFKGADSFTGDLSNWLLKGHKYEEMFAHAANFVNVDHLPRFESAEALEAARVAVTANKRNQTRGDTQCSGSANSVVAQVFARFSL